MAIGVNGHPRLGPDPSLVGRDRELALLTAMLEQPTVRLVTVTGPAGVGKTRLGYAAADLAARNAGRRTVRVELESIGDAQLVVEAIAATAGADHPSRGGPALDAAAQALAGDGELLVLDNFEHVASAAGDVAALLAARPGATALITSRHVLHLAGEHMLPLAPLALPAAGERDPERAARSAAVALFVVRARARDPEFELTEDMTPAVVEICRRRGGRRQGGERGGPPRDETVDGGDGR